MQRNLRSFKMENRRILIQALTLTLSLLICFQISQSAEFSNGVTRIFLYSEGTGTHTTKQLASVTWDSENLDTPSDCEIIKDRNAIEKILRISAANGQIVRDVDQAEFQELVNDCSELRERRDAIATENPLDVLHGDTPEDESSWNIIFPGTKWCGAGDKAENYDDLGMHSETDKCCRAHDLCDDLIPAGQSKHNLTNSSPFTKLSCQCDLDFYNCLDKVDSMISNKIGNLYFNILRRDCYTWDYPLTRKCKTYRSFLKITCKEYEKDTKGSKTYRWEKAKTYKKLPIPGPLTITLPF